MTHKRLFIGIPLDEQCQQQIDIALQLLRARDDIRWVPKQNQHLTLAFLGATLHNELQTLQQHFAETYSGEHAFPFELKQLTRFPDARGHILAAVNIPSPELLQLYQRTRNLLNHCHIAFEEREYRPHITLGRIRHPKQLQTQFNQTTALRLQIHSVNLYESIATDNGREYRVLVQSIFQTNR